MAKFKRKLYRYLPQVKIAAISLSILVIILILFSVVKIVKSALKSANVSPYQVYSAVFKNVNDLKQKDGRINILLLGVGDESHDGPNLTDTMIFVSINPETRDIFTLPLPRDIWSDELKDKINSAYAYGEEKKRGGGITLSKAVVSEITDLPVHYVIKINFTAFEKLINLLGGIDINVENSFTDEKFPIPGKENENCDQDDKEFKCRYETIKFEKGPQHMDGKTALNFVRSRYANGVEGTDFARSRRQLNVLTAIKSKAFSIKTLTDEKLISSLINTVMENIETDTSQEEAVIFAKTALKFKDARIRHGVLDWGDPQNHKQGLLINPPLSEEYKYAWILVPRNNNWKEIHDYIKSEVTKPAPSP